MKASTDTSVDSIVTESAGSLDTAGAASSQVEAVNRNEICGGERAKFGAIAICVLKQCSGKDLKRPNIELVRSKKG